MELKIISDIENPLFNRREIEGEIHAEVVPSREDVRKIISEKFSANSDAIKIKTIKGKFGQKVFLIVANIYKSKEELDKVELKKKKDLESEKKVEAVKEEVKPVETEIQEEPVKEEKAEAVEEKPVENLEAPSKEIKPEETKQEGDKNE